MGMKTSMDLDSLESSLAGLIAQSTGDASDDTILGFVEVDEGTQKQILEALRRGCLIGTIGGMLTHYPCLTTYGLSVAAPIGMMDDAVFNGGFYNAWESAFDYKPENGLREGLATAFNRAVEVLGLPVGTISPEKPAYYKGGCYLFHSGILPHFVQPLKSALEKALKRRPLPDPDDDRQCESFAHLLADFVHPTQQRLRKTLHCSVGSFLVRRLVRWHLTGNDNLFPAHIQGLLAEQKGRTLFVQSPYLSLDEVTGELLLTLPAQNDNVAGPDARWTLPGLAPARAATERPPIPLSELDLEGETFRITLSHLKQNLDEIEYVLKAGTSPATPFLIFETKRNREQRVNLAAESIGLRPGEEFLVLLSPTTQILSPHKVEHIGESRVVRFKASPSEEALVLASGGRSWCLRPAVKPGLYLARDEASQISVISATGDRRLDVAYGKGFELVCCLPPDVKARELEISTPLDAKYSQIIPLPDGSRHGGLVHIDLTDALRSWLDGLPDAIIRVQVSVRLPSRSLQLDWLFWKGLERLTIYGDIRWNSSPTNLVRHSGFRSATGGLNREQRHGGHAELEVRGLGRFETERLIVPSNAVEVFLVTEAGAAQHVDPKESLQLVGTDRRVVQFRSGGLMPIALRANGQQIGTLTPAQPTLCRYPEALILEAGKTATVLGETILPVPGEPSWRVVSWQAPLTAKQVHTPDAGQEVMTWLVRQIQAESLSGLQAKFRRIDKGFDGVDEELVTPLKLPDSDEPEPEVEAIHGISISLVAKSKGVDLEVNFDRKAQAGAVWSVEVEGKLDDSTKWQTLVVPEGHGRLARVRFLMVGAAPAAPSVLRDLFWTSTVDELPPDSPVLRMDDASLASAIRETEELLSWKYPTSVWHQNAGRLKSLCTRISAAAAGAGPAGQGAWWGWAIRSLSKHSREHQSVVIPELPILHGLRIAAQPLAGSLLPQLPSEGVVARSFAEAVRFEPVHGKASLDYVTGACQTNRVDLRFFQCFSGFNTLIRQADVPLGHFRLKEWIQQIYEDCKAKGLALDEEESPLLSSAHLVRCLTKARRRCHVLNSVSAAEEGHWLSGPISRLHQHADEVESSIHTLLNNQLQGAPVELLWKPFVETPLFSDAGDAANLLRALMPGNLLIALALRQHAAGKISSSTLAYHLRKTVGGSAAGSSLHNQTGLLIATAPELFAYYFLLFTFIR